MGYSQIPCLVIYRSLGFKGLGFRVEGLGFSVQGLGLMVQSTSHGPRNDNSLLLAPHIWGLG